MQMNVTVLSSSINLFQCGIFYLSEESWGRRNMFGTGFIAYGCFVVLEWMKRDEEDEDA